MKIVLINQPLGNRGDESAHRAFVRYLLENIPNIQIRVLFVDCYSVWSMEQYRIPDDRVNYINIHSVRWYKKISARALQKGKFYQYLWPIHPTTKAIINQYKWADYVVCSPGGINLGGFQDWDHLFLLNLAQYTKKPLAYFGRSFGPFPVNTKEQIKFYDLSCKSLRYFSFLSIRDHTTALLADKMKLQYVETVDTAFIDNPIVKLPYDVRHMINKTPYAIFVPNELLWHYAYKDKIDREELVLFYGTMAKSILKSYPDINIVMLPQLYGTWHLDVDFFRDIADSLADDRIVVLPDCYSSDIQQTIIKDASFLIGARYHSIVFALNQNIPFIALSYEHKISGLLETLHKSNVCIDISEAILSESGRMQCLEKISELLPTIKKDNTAHSEAKSIATKGAERFIEYLSKMS